MGDGAYLWVRGAAVGILGRQETKRMQAFACIAQHVSWEKMGSCCQQKNNSTLALLTWADAGVNIGCPAASTPNPGGMPLRFSIGATAGEQWHQPCPHQM